MQPQSTKQNARRKAFRLAQRYGTVEDIEPIKCDGGWVAAVRVIDGVLPSTVPPEVIEACHVDLPEGWVIDDEVFVIRREDLPPAPEPVASLMDSSVVLIDAPHSPETDAARDRLLDAGHSVISYDEGNQPVLSNPPEVNPIDAILATVKAGTKRAQMFAMLRKGATVAEVAEALGWQNHTARAAIATQPPLVGLAVVTEGKVKRLAMPQAASQAA